MQRQDQSGMKPGGSGGQSSRNEPSQERSASQEGMSGVMSDAKESLADTARETLATATQAAREVTEETQEQVEGVVSQAVGQTTQAISDIKENATTAYTEQRDRAVEMLNALADALRSTGRNLSSQSGTDGQDDKAAMSLAPYIDEAADRLSQSANFLREKEMSGLLHEAQTLAKKQPMLFLGAMFGIGVAGARIIKGMSDGDDSQSRDAEGQSSNGQRDMPESSGGTMADAGGRLGSDWNQSAAARAAGSSTTGASTPEPAASTLSGAYPRSSAGAAESPGERS